jgi:hypothetical protein
MAWAAGLLHIHILNIDSPNARWWKGICKNTRDILSSICTLPDTNHAQKYQEERKIQFRPVAGYYCTTTSLLGGAAAATG